MSIRAVLGVWSLALLAAGGGVALILASDRPWPAASVVLSAVIGLTFVGAQYAREAAQRRPLPRASPSRHAPIETPGEAAGPDRIG